MYCMADDNMLYIYTNVLLINVFDVYEINLICKP